MRRLSTITGTILVLLLALTPAGPVAGRDPEAPTPLLEALAYSRPFEDPYEVTFVDWAQLKRLYGGEDITSASPLAERQRLLLEISRHESMPFELGLDRLAIWPDAWGWDNTDLDWEARDWDRTVLRFGDDWDPAPFRAALERFGYESATVGRREVWQPGEAAEMPRGLALLGIGYGIPGRRGVEEPVAGVVISPDGRTVVVHRFGEQDHVSARRLARASLPDLERIVDKPAGMAAAALGQQLGARVVAGREFGPCRDSRVADSAVTETAEHLHRYEALANGYSRAAAGSGPQGRLVFSYRRPRQARADLPVRHDLAVQGSMWGRPWATVRAPDARVDGTELIIDVQPDDDLAWPELAGWGVSLMPFAQCSSGVVQPI